MNSRQSSIFNRCDQQPVTHHRPCQICGKPDWCMVLTNPATKQIEAIEAKLSTFGQSKAVIKQCQGGHFTVHVTVTNGSSSRGGAGSHSESIVARGFAYRNAVRQMILNDERDQQI